MKKAIILALTLVSYTINAQIKVISESKTKDTVIWKTKNPYSTLPKLVHFLRDSTINDYTFYYKNAKYKQITDVKYLGLGNKQSATDFFNICLDVITNDKEVKLEIDKDLYIISKSGKSAMIFKSSSHFYLSEKEVVEILEKLQ